VGHGKKSTEGGALTGTFWRPQRDVSRLGKKGDRARGTHVLKAAEGGTSHDLERMRPSEGTHLHVLWETADGGTSQDRKRPSEGHLLPGDSRGRDLSEHGKNATKRGGLTS
jgi:hypothetical protein